MKKLFFFLLLLVSENNLSAQTGFIRDPDGFTNVRAKADTKSEITDTLHEGRIVFAFEEMKKGEWCLVDYNEGEQTRNGYIHRSRIVFLDELTEFKRKKITDSLVRFQLDSLEIVFSTGKFNKKGRVIKYETPKEGGKFVKSVDGFFPWGTDGEIPKVEYKFLHFKVTDSTLKFSRHLYRDLFEPNLPYTSAYLDRSTGNIYIEALNSDAAGGYLVVWIIEQEGIWREVFIPF